MYTIRTMTINDYDDVYSIWINTPGMGLNKTDDSRDGIYRYIKRNPSTCFVAVDNIRIIGVIIAGHDGRRGYIYHTAVLMEYRNKGIATELVNSAIDALRNEGITKIALVAFKNNEIGNQFWEAKGFNIRTDLCYRNKNLIEPERIDT